MDLIRFSPDVTMISTDSSQNPHRYMSRNITHYPMGFDIPNSPPLQSSTPIREPYDFSAVVPPPRGYSPVPESPSISTDELRYTSSQPSTVVLGDISSIVDYDLSLDNSLERDIRAAILHQNEPYCRKVFVGSIPYGATVEDLEEFFSRFGRVDVDLRAPAASDKCGFGFITYDDPKSVNLLLHECMTGEDSTTVILLPLRTIEKAGKFISLQVVVRAWRTADRFWKNSLLGPGPLSNRYSVFVGGVPRICTAVSLAQVFDHDFGSVGKVVVEIEPGTGFPKGVARVTFLTRDAFISAVSQKYVKLFTLKPVKMVEVKPYLETSLNCERCEMNPTDLFCIGCMCYMCDACWGHNCAMNIAHTPMRRSDPVRSIPQGVFLTQLGFQGVPLAPSLYQQSLSPAKPPSSLHSSQDSANYPFPSTPVSSARTYKFSPPEYGSFYGNINNNTEITPPMNAPRQRSPPVPFKEPPRQHSMLHSLPNRRTPLGSLVPMEMRHDYSLRVFICGLPSGISADDLTLFFTSFGHVSVLTPLYESKHAFLHFSNVNAVRALVARCNEVNNRLSIPVYFEQKCLHAVVQIRPWLKHNRVWLNGSLPINYDLNSTSARFSIFIGGVPRSTTASELAQVVQSHFGDVAVLMIDVDAVYEYPRGSARAVFLTKDVYVRAIQQKFLMVYSHGQPCKFQVELKPFLDAEVPCEICGNSTASRQFCPELTCLKYYCHACWQAAHFYMTEHRPLRPHAVHDNNGTPKRRGEKKFASYPAERTNFIEHLELQPKEEQPQPPPASALPMPNFAAVMDPWHPAMAHMNTEMMDTHSPTKDYGPIGSGRPK